MAIEIIPKPKPTIKVSLWLNVLFFLSIVLLLITFPSYFILKNLEKDADLKLQKLEEDIKVEKSTLREWIAGEEAMSMEQKEKKLEEQKKKIEDFALVIDKHQLISKLFLGKEAEGGKRELGWLEKLTHPKVFFSSFNLNAAKLTLGLSGETESFQTLGQQLIIFKEESLVKKVELTGVAKDKEGKIAFSIGLSLAPQIFK